jgi:hypothetical protein
MIKRALIGAFLILTVAAHADDTVFLLTSAVNRSGHKVMPTIETDTEAGIVSNHGIACKECWKKANAARAVAMQVPPPRPRIAHAPPPRSRISVLLANRRGKSIAPGCYERIMDQNGNVNPVGQMLVAEMSKKNNLELFTENRGLASVCPKFASMDAPAKLKAWTWFWLVLGNREAGDPYDCRPSTRHHTPPRAGIGIWGLELNPVTRAWRGPDCHGDMSKVERQVSCAVSTMANQQLRRGKAFQGRSYWSSINNRSLVQDMQRYAPCR